MEPMWAHFPPGGAIPPIMQRGRPMRAGYTTSPDKINQTVVVGAIGLTQLSGMDPMSGMHPMSGMLLLPGKAPTPGKDTASGMHPLLGMDQLTGMHPMSAMPPWDPRGAQGGPWRPMGYPAHGGPLPHVPP